MGMISLELALKCNALCNSRVSFWFLVCCVTLIAKRNINTDLTRHWWISLISCSVQLCQERMYVYWKCKKIFQVGKLNSYVYLRNLSVNVISSRKW